MSFVFGFFCVSDAICGVKSAAILILFLSLCFYDKALAQISPPGMDDTHAAGWGAIGVNQEFGKKWAVTVYVGASRESDPVNYSLIRKQAIVVFNQETLYKFNARWQLAVGTSYRMQNRYKEEAPYTASTPALRDEARYYLRFYYKAHIRKASMTYSFRPEFRNYYTPSGTRWSVTPVELRFRFKVQAALPLNEAASNQFIVANEWLSATDEIKDNQESSHWSTLKYTEDRLSTYFRHTFKKPAVFADIGMMHQMKSDGDYIVHLAFDLIFQNPFGRR